MNLPTPPPTSLWQDLAELQRMAEDVQARMTDPAQKRMLGEMLQKFSATRAEAQEIVPPILQKIKKDAEANLAEVPKFQAELERIQADLEAKHAAAMKLAEEMAAPPVAPEPPPIDPDKGRKLTDELRNRFAPPKTAADTFEDAGSVAREWVDTEGADASAVPPTPHRPPTMSPQPPSSSEPKPEKEPKKDDIWEGLSRMEGD